MGLAKMFEWLTGHHTKVPVEQLEAAFQAHTEARKNLCEKGTEVSERITEQEQQSVAILDAIRERATRRGQNPSPGLIAIAHTLKSLEKHS